MEAKLLWTPSTAFAANSNLSHFIGWLKSKKDLAFSDYNSLWVWSVQNTDDFWKSILEYFDVVHSGQAARVTVGRMPEVKWFEGVQLNYAENVFRNAHDERPAIVFKSEASHIKTISWRELTQQTSSVQKFLRANGIEVGDRVAGYLPCIPEATASMLATVSLGAIWSSASPDFGTEAVIERFKQIEPKVLIAADHYQYGGKRFDKSDVITKIAEGIPSIRAIIVITTGDKPLGKFQVRWSDVVLSDGDTLVFNRVPFDHPIWVLYSSGTTGLPKAITHSHGGILIEQLKYASFHNDFKAGERCFWYTTTGWMMWNYIHGALLCGATMVIYDGSPGYPDLEVLWRFAGEARVTHFGTSAAFILANMKANVVPQDISSFGDLRSIGSTGSTLPPEGFAWVYANVKKDLWLASMSGGTDVCSAFVGGNPLWPVWSGEIQCRALGCKLEAFSEEGVPVVGEVGEMVITQPMPSMPVFFWNDENRKRYRESYFETFDGVWRHGDWIEITPRSGIIIYGRSDATLNRGGIRIGTSEIYRAIDQIREVKDSLIICIEKEGGEFWMPLFVVMQDNTELTDAVKSKINTTLRNTYSPRHVPDEIIQAPDIPYTISGKKTETPVKKVLMGRDPKKVVNEGSLRNPSSMDFFIELGRSK
jgi:acetoacetyl-CoA synthetase